MKKNNKKRNTGLMYEFLVRAMSQSLVDKDDRRSAVVLKIVKESFAEGTELRKELTLLQQLMRSHASGDVASRLVSEAKRRACSLDAAKLDREKSLLIRNVNHKIGDDMFYERHVGEYRTMQTLQSLFNEWRSREPDLSRLASLEGELVESLGAGRREAEQAQESDTMSPGQRRLLMSVMTEKLNKKYGTSLNSAQRELLRGFVRSSVSGSDGLRETMLKIRDDLVASINEYSVAEDASPDHRQKLDEVKERLVAETTLGIDEATLVRFMAYAKLFEELQSD